MLNEKDYQAAFSKVRASEDTYQEVMSMTGRRKNRKSAGGRRVAVLIAAVIALMAVTVTAFAAEEIAGWFQSYFSRHGEKQLTEQQAEYISENEQIIGQSKTESGWTVELRSAIQDGSTGYIILGVTAPEGVYLAPECDENGDRQADFTFGNTGMAALLNDAPDILTAPEGVSWGNWGYSWEEDGDGQYNTKNFVIRLNPDMERSTIDPFGDAAEYYIYMENITWEYVDEDYRQELLEGKYAGQKDIMFTSEETKRLYCTDILAEGIWDFSITFTDPDDNDAHDVELLAEPVTTTACVFRSTGPEITDYADVEEAVTLTSVVMRHLTVTFCCEDCDGVPSYTLSEENPQVVLKDGSQLKLFSYGSSGTSYVTLVADQPIVFEEVDHIRMADGTIIPMPELETE